MTTDPQHAGAPLEALLAHAKDAHRRGDLEAARPLYQRVIELAPESADAWHFLGLLLAQGGAPAEGIEAMRRSIALEPDVPGWHSNLGNVLRMIHCIDDASAAYERSLALAEDPAAHNNLGSLRRLQGRRAEAEASFYRAVELHPGFGAAWLNLGNVLLERGRRDLALEAFDAATLCEVTRSRSSALKARVLASFGRLEEAAAIYRALVAADPEDAISVHELAACAGDAVPDRAADAYVGTFFDAMADGFDAVLALLEYRAPALVRDRVASLVPTADGSLDVLDAGCGTGLCAPLLRPYARRLVGVDLSAGMLEKARARGGYDALAHAELTAYLAAQHAAYDLVVSADTLCYFGRLEAAMAGACGALRPGGHLVLTVEAIDEADADGRAGGGPAGFRLNAHGRYAHSRRYLDEVLRAAGFGAPTITPVILRLEYGREVHGFLASAPRPR